MPKRRSRKKRRAGTFGSILLLLVLILVAYSYFSGVRLPGMPQLPPLKLTGLPTWFPQLPGFGNTPPPKGSPESPATPASEVSASGEWYQLYFTGPTPDNQSGGIPDKVAASFDAAQKTLDVAVYEFNLTSLSDALIRAAQRGVRVRLVTDTDSMQEETIQALLTAGVPVVDDQRSAIMHDKFVVMDSSVVWVGSMNFTVNDAYKNDNNFMRISSTHLAQNYTAEFEEMFGQREFGPGSPANTPNPSLNLNGTQIENYFSPDDGVAAHILDVLNSAQKSIYFMAFTFTRTDFTDVMIARAQAGVTVQGVFEKRQIAAGADQAWNALTNAGLEVRQDGNSFTMHNKVIVVDGQIVVTGSYNFTKAAEDSNDENVLIIHNPEIAAAYMNEWKEIWNVAEK